MKLLFYLSLLLLLPCICQAEKYDKYGYSDKEFFFIEIVLDRNYNVRLGFPGSVSKKNVFLSFDWFYIRVMKDTYTWRFHTSMLVSCLGMLITTAPVVDRDNATAYELFLLDKENTISRNLVFAPSILMNPTIGLRLTEWLNIAVGYNTDLHITPFTSHPGFYFAPKIQLGLVIAQKVLLSTILSYQVFDFFATKRGFHFSVCLR